jgi:hypothetical protein
MMAAGSVSTQPMTILRMVVPNDRLFGCPAQTDLEAAVTNASAVGDCSQSLPLPRGHLSRQLVAVLQPPKVPKHRSPCHALTMLPALLQAAARFRKPRQALSCSHATNKKPRRACHA